MYVKRSFIVVGYLCAIICSIMLPRDIFAETKTLSQQLKEEEEREKKANTYQGSQTSASKALEKARRDAKADATSCPTGSTTRKSEDVRVYIERHELTQQKIAESLERFTSQTITKQTAVNEFNGLINENNELTRWGWGKVTNGVCGPVKVTELIGRAIGATDNLITQYRTAIESRN